MRPSTRRLLFRLGLTTAAALAAAVVVPPHPAAAAKLGAPVLVVAVDLDADGVINEFDDDMDGATDCNDLKCVTSQLCTQFQCRPDENEGLIALTGAPSASGVVQTTGAGNDQTMTSCVTMPGGHDAVWPSSPTPRWTTSNRSGSDLAYRAAAARRSPAVAGACSRCVIRYATRRILSELSWPCDESEPAARAPLDPSALAGRGTKSSTAIAVPSNLTPPRSIIVATMR